jgi:hypothetical protein
LRVGWICRTLPSVTIRASLIASLVGAVLLTLPGTVGANPAQQLVETYAPITMLREEQDPPYVALGRTLLYFDLGARAGKVPAKRWRERLPRRTAAAEA